MEKEVKPSRTREVLFEGFTSDEVLRLPSETLRQLVLLKEPIVFRVGSATILGRFAVTSSSLVVELAQIEGGGEGIGETVRRTQPPLCDRMDRSRSFLCETQFKTAQSLERRGFRVEQLADIGAAYHLVEPIKKL